MRNLRLPALAALAFAALSAPAQADVLADYHAAVGADTPIGYWHLDETSGTSVADFGSAAAPGTLSGPVTLGAAAPFAAPANTAMTFAAAGTMTAMVPGTMHSAELWVRPSQRVGQAFLTYGDPATATGWSIGLGSKAAGGQKRRLVFTASGKTTNSKVSLPAGSWSMVYVSWGPGNNLRVALNGGAVSKTPAPGGLPNQTPSLNPLVIGPGAGTGGTRIDEVAVFPGRPNPATHFHPSALPEQQTPPVITTPSTDPPKAGDTITVTPGTWSPGTDVTYEWQRCDSVGACQTIEGATGPTYTLTPADAGFTIQVRETGTNGSGSITVISDGTDPVTQSDGSAPASAPVLPPGSDPTVPAEDSQEALDAGGALSDPNALLTGGGTTGGTSGGAPTGTTTTDGALVTVPWTAGGASNGAPPSATTARVCTARLRPVRARRVKLGGKRRLTVRVNGATRVVSVKAPRRSLKRVTWTLDGRRVRAARSGALRLPALRAGSHVLRGRITPRKGKARKVALKLVAACG